MPKRPQAIYLLSKDIQTLVYGPEERRDIAATLGAPPMLVEPSELDGEAYDLSDVTLVFSGWGMPKLDAALLRRMPKLKVVFYGAGSIKYFMTDDAWDRGIQVCSAYAANAVPVTEFTLAQILLSLKQTWRMALSIRQNGRFPSDRSLIAGAYGSTVALLSLGMIGRMVAERLRTFDLKIIAYDPFVKPDRAKELGVRLVSLEEAFAEAHVVSCHTPWLKETEGMIRGRHFESMQRGATFINTARGAVVHEPEMIAALQRRPDLTALLDVTYPEPPVAGSPLYTLPNVVLSPHIAGSIGRECHRMARLMVEECARWKAGQPLQWSISRERAAILA